MTERTASPPQEQERFARSALLASLQSRGVFITAPLPVAALRGLWAAVSGQVLENPLPGEGENL